MKKNPEFDAKDFCKRLTKSSGVYQMFDADGEVIYIGKANNLKNRVSSYFLKSAQSNSKTQSLVSQIASIEVTVTNSETEALLLECTLINKHLPKYNILLRDDKSYPYIHLSQHSFPRLDFHRGRKAKKGRYFGPYPSAGAVRETLNLLQKIFKLRSCNDTFFSNRTRPCLQYQIKRCTAPCVAYIDQDEYAQSIKHAVLFLQGRNQEIIEWLEHNMDQASLAQQYELAAVYRDQIKSLRKVQEQQIVTSDKGDIDIIAAEQQQQYFCVQVMSIRHGRLIGSKPYFPKTPADSDISTVLSAFVSQYYSNSIRMSQIPKTIIISHELDDLALIKTFLSEQRGSQVECLHRVRGLRAKWLSMTKQNAEVALSGHLSSKASVYRRFESLQKLLKLESMPQRIECFDISHTGGDQTVASCVVFDNEGPMKSNYRRFNITGITKADDYAAMHQALTRRYTKLKQGEGVLPDILLIDGGKGQLSQAEAVLEELQVSGVLVVAVAKGEGRKPGLETLILAHSRQHLQCPADSPALHLIQQIRDEAHRFAITGHRQRRAKQKRESPLEHIEGVGAKRRQALLKRFGGWQELKRASVDEIAKVPGISLTLAQKIHALLHD